MFHLVVLELSLILDVIFQFLKCVTVLRLCINLHELRVYKILIGKTGLYYNRLYTHYMLACFFFNFH